MKEFLKQYCLIVAYAMTGLVFVFASFFLIVNLYHQSELSKTFILSPLDATLSKFTNSVNSSKEFLKDFNVNKYTGTLTAFQSMAAHQRLNECVNILTNDKVKDMTSKTEISIVDVYYARESFENEVLGKCVVGNLGWFANAENNKIDNEYLKQNEVVLSLYLDALRTESSYLKKDLLNNSSFYFNTSLVSNTIRHNVRDGYYDIMASYNKVAVVVETLSNWFYEETKGARS